MGEALPRKIMQRVMADAALCEFNALARSCKWLQAHAESVAVDYADNESATCVFRDGSIILKLPNGVRHGMSRIIADGATTVVMYDRGNVTTTM